MSKDIMTEMLTGEPGAVRCIGKFVLSPRWHEIDGLPLVMMIGTLVSLEGKKLVAQENEKFHEMWECEVIIIPKRKYGSLRDNNQFCDGDGECRRVFNGYRADQILCADFGNPKIWGPKYFDSKEQPRD